MEDAGREHVRVCVSVCEEEREKDGFEGVEREEGWRE